MKDVQYVVNEGGEKTAVLLSLEQYEALLDHLEDLDIAEAARQSRGETGRPLSEFMAELLAEGGLDV